MNLTSENLTVSMNVPISVVTNTTDKLVFNFYSSMCQITNCTVTAIGALLNAIEDHPNGLEDLRRIVNMQNMCPQLFTDNKVMKMLYIGVERNIIQNIMNNSFSGDSVSYNLQDLSMTVDNLTNLTSANGNIIQIKAPEILIHNGTYIPETWIPTDAFQGIAEDQRKVSVVIYKPSNQFVIPNMPYDDNNWQILSYITYIGCGLSAFFTALSLITYVFTRNRSVDHANAIHISLSGALFLLNSFFILNEWVASLGINGVPGVVVGISLAFQNTQHFYGSTVTTLANSNKTNTICWITNITFFYGVNLGYFTFTFVMNSGILLTVTTRICQLKCLDNKHKAGKGSLVFKDVCTVLGLTCLLGVTWGLAFLSIGYYNLVILYLFTIFNSLQGFFIFLWICGSVRKERELAAKTKSTAVAMNTSVAKSKEGFSEGNNPYQ
uniref:G-protein coupled receptors family 2 profile 2 domain-containing protein n=1 Tax=Esox lucius TaxID=8010 RepID=A0AAY5K7W5_ESOLU